MCPDSSRSTVSPSLERELRGIMVTEPGEQRVWATSASRPRNHAVRRHVQPPRPVDLRVVERTGPVRRGLQPIDPILLGEGEMGSEQLDVDELS